MGEPRVLFRASIGVVVRRNGLPIAIGRACQWYGMTVKRNTRRAEDGAAVEDRQDLLLRSRHLPIPQLEMAAVLFLPILVEINEDIDAPIQPQTLVVAEVCVDFQ